MARVVVVAFDSQALAVLYSGRWCAIPPGVSNRERVLV